MRKLPRQQRSRALVESLIIATLRIIAHEGLTAATTPRIAAKAGVSVGSLYQYFDRKEDLFEAVLERFVTEMTSLIDQQNRVNANEPLSGFIRNLLHAIWSFLEQDGGVYLQLARHWNQLDSGRFLTALEQKMLAVVSQKMLANPNLSPTTHANARVYVLVNSIMLTLVRFIAEPNPAITREELITQFVALAECLMQTANA